jgi:flagellar hook-associated protein 3 FlgL
MRVATSWSHQLSLNAILSQQAKATKTQLQLSSGLKILTPADDPSASVRVLDYQQSIAKTTQYQDNIETARARNNVEDSALNSSVNVLQRARELAVQSLNSGALTATDKKAMEQEVRQLLDNMVGIANTKNANGEYIFSGDLSGTQPFKYDSTVVPPLSQPTGYVYQGGVNQRVMQISEDRQVADGDLGSTVFEDIQSVSLAAVAKNGKQSIFETLSTFADALAGKFLPVNAAIQGDRMLKYGLDYSAGGKSFDLAVDGGAATAINIPAGNYTNVDDLVGAVNAGISASALNGTVTARVSGNNIEFVSALSGANSAVAISNDATGVLTDLGFNPLGQSAVGANSSTFINVDGTPKDMGVVYDKTVNDVLTGLDAAFKSIGNAQAKVGARGNALDDQQNQNDKFVLDTQTTLSQTQDLDYAEAITKFNLQNTTLQAAQQSFAKIQSLSLFDYIR